MKPTAATIAAPPPVASRPTAAGRQQNHWHDRIAHVLLLLVCAILCIFLLLPVVAILVKSVQDKDGNFVGLSLFIDYMSTPALQQSILNTFLMASAVTVIVIPAAFTFAYALTRSTMPGKSMFRTISLVPILAPSLLAAISFIQWFGTQGILKHLLGSTSIYGPLGIIISECYGVFPHALMILITALTMADGRLYEAAESLGTSRLRKFWTITLPGAKYGLISAALVVFTFTVNDFGVPKVIGGNFNVLSIDVYKQVIGQQNFNKGAVVSLLLLLPALVAFAIDIIIRRKLRAQLSARAVPYVPKKNKLFDAAMFTYCSLISIFMLGVLGMAMFTSVIKLWPYDLSFSLRHYYFGLVEGGILESYFNSVKLALWVVVAGITLVFGTAYLTEKTRGMDSVRPIIRLLAVLPMGVPGLVLGLGYILFFNEPGNPLNFMYHTMAILVVSTVIHYYTSSHLTAVTALKAIDNEFEAVSASLKVPFYKTFFRVTVPVCLPAILDIGRYLFVNAMTTISAVVFLYSPDSTLASVAILNLEEAGEIGPAAAMATLIVFTSTGVCLLYALATRVLLKRTQGWRS
ncbi:putative 2-aminoethylphosphonate ABC transporter permease subunit [Noviherbaspirillum cavernae]|uniref:Putative 2-aminoethylphosphonate ABC transporter permease subunit n=1 Tax=Noviherbaspirillum cavernae TaxID=2320862 RepID=A0A418WVD1_9BURK|nr:putative 2-aminoethylphosphonate ABC transporter permease subunit [Noviherbaspirillum cavernae]RJF96559.1 putative 2-aminoethylphosphonate ABC transporter permease subunit [Noviherbaspirillum cavernae]